MNRFALQEDTSLIGDELASNEIKQGGFASTIGTDEAGNLALFDGATHAVQRQQPAKTFRHLTDLKQLHTLPVVMWNTCRPCTTVRVTRTWRTWSTGMASGSRSRQMKSAPWPGTSIPTALSQPNMCAEPTV